MKDKCSRDDCLDVCVDLWFIVGTVCISTLWSSIDSAHFLLITTYIYNQSHLKKIFHLCKSRFLGLFCDRSGKAYHLRVYQFETPSQKVSVASIFLFSSLCLWEMKGAACLFNPRGESEMTASRCSGRGGRGRLLWGMGGGGSRTHMVYRDKSHMHGGHVAEIPFTPPTPPPSMPPPTHKK